MLPNVSLIKRGNFSFEEYFEKNPELYKLLYSDKPKKKK
jgi:hypothetical protein